MANTGYKGIDIRQTSSRLVFRASLKDATGAKLTSGATTYRLYELQDDGNLLSYDFNDNTFKGTALTTATASMAHQQGNNDTHDTGIWTAALTTITGFTDGAIYLIQINNSGAAPTDQEREFQFGSVQGEVSGVDLEATLRRIYAGAAGDGAVSGSGPYTIEYDGPDGTVAITSTATGGNRANSYS